MAQQIRMLSNLQTVELSTVRRAANKRVFAVTKSENEMKLVQAVLGTKAEGEDQYIATLKSAGADEKRIEAATAAYRLQKGFADVLKSEDFGVVSKAHPEPDGDECGDEEGDEDGDEKPAFMKKAKKTKKSAQVDLAGLAPEVRAQVEGVFKSNQELVAKAATLEAMVKQLADANASAQYVAKAEREFAHVPGTPNEIAAVLKSAHETSPELAKGLEKILASVNEAVSKSALLHSVGTTGSYGPSGNAWTKIEQLAGSLTLKSEDGADMSHAQKIAHVTTKTAEGRALYREYLAENPAQRAKSNF